MTLLKASVPAFSLIESLSSFQVFAAKYLKDLSLYFVELTFGIDKMFCPLGL